MLFFSCDVCNEKFRYRRAMKKHKLSHSPAEEDKDDLELDPLEPPNMLLPPIYEEIVPFENI